MSAHGDREPDASGCERCGRVECPARTAGYKITHSTPPDEAERMERRFAEATADCDAHVPDWRSLYFAARAREGAADLRPSSRCMMPDCKRAPHSDGECWLCPKCTREGAASATGETAALIAEAEQGVAAGRVGAWGTNMIRALAGALRASATPAPPAASARERVIATVTDVYEYDTFGLIELNVGVGDVQGIAVGQRMCVTPLDGGEGSK